MRKIIILIFLLSFPAASFSQIAVAGKMRFSYNSKPGATIRDTIKIINTGSDRAEISLYLSDYNGKFYDPGTLPRSAAAWITIRDPRVLIPPDSFVEIDFTVRVPKKIKESGAFFCLLFVHETSRNRQRTKPIGVNLRRRYGFPIVVNLPGGFQDLEFKRIAYENGRITIDVSNTGTLILNAACSVQIAGAFLESKNNLKIYPGGSRAFTFDRVIPDGEYKSRIFIDLERGDTFGSRFTFKIGKTEPSKVKKKLYRITTPLSFRITARWTNEYKSTSIYSAFRLWKFRLDGRARFSDRWRDLYTGSIALDFKWFSIRGMAYAHKNDRPDWNVSTSIRIGDFYLSGYYKPIDEHGSIFARLYLFGSTSISANVFYRNRSIDNWSVDLSIPIDIKIRREVREKSPPPREIEIKKVRYLNGKD